jgi:hypothetical protein
VKEKEDALKARQEAALNGEHSLVEVQLRLLTFRGVAAEPSFSFVFVSSPFSTLFFDSRNRSSPTRKAAEPISTRERTFSANSFASLKRCVRHASRRRYMLA